MFKHKSIAKLISISSLIVISTLTFLLGTGFILNRYAEFNKNARRLEQDFIQEQVDLIQLRVNEIIEYIDYNRSQTESVLKESIRNRVMEAYQVIQNIYKKFRGRKSKGEITEMVKDALRPIRFNGGRGYFFIDDFQRNIILYPPQPELEGTKPEDKTSISGFIEVLQKSDESFRSYTWFKPGTAYNHTATADDVSRFQKIAFIKRFGPYNWIIGTGEYRADVERDIKNKVLDRIKRVRFGREKKYFFSIFELAGSGPEGRYATVVLNPNIQGLSGNNLSIDLKDSNGKFFIRDLQQQIDGQGEAIIGFTFRNPNTNQELSKISFYKKYPGWNWLVGSGFYPKDLQKTILENKKVLQSHLKIEVLIILAAFAVVFLLALLVANIFAKTIKREFKIFTNFFKQSALKHELLSKEKLAVEEFRELADSANIMIQAKKEGEDALVEAKEIAVAATKAKTEFLANMSHEIRTPMNTIIGMIDVLLKSKLGTKEKGYIEIIKVSTNNLLTIINDILDISKIEAGKFDLEMKPFSVRGVVENVADMISVRAHRQGLELITSIDPEVPQVMVGDPTHLSQVLLNLANNAVKFTEHGEILITVELAEHLNGELKLIFRVKDTGIGIAGDSMEKLFRTFSQVDGSKSRKYRGTGLGLYISKQLIRLMHGDIGVESEEGKGSTFWFTAVFKTAEEQESAPVSDKMPFKGRRVMIVDANETSLEVFEKQLKSLGFTCFAKQNWPDAKKKMMAEEEAGKPLDLVLLNLDLRDHSCKDLLAAVKNERISTKTKRILIGSKITPHEDDEILNLGFDRILTKPVKERDLWHALGSVLKVEILLEGEGDPVEGGPVSAVEQDLHLKVLLVEDHGFNREVVKLNLEQFGFQVVVAQNGEDAIEKFKGSHFDLILMDVHMEVMDGNEATRHIREMEKDRLNIFGKVIHTPIIAMTADVTKESINESMKAGMTDFVGKPFTTAKLVHVIKKVMKKDLKELKIDPPHDIEDIAEGDDSMRNSIIKNLKAMGVQNQATIDKVITKGKHSIEEGLLLSGQDLEQDDSSQFLSHIHNVKGILLNLGLNELAEEVRLLEEHVKVSQLDSKAIEVFSTLREQLLQSISRI